MVHSSDFSNHGGPVYVPYSSVGQAGPSSYVEGQYAPPPLPGTLPVNSTQLVATGMAICKLYVEISNAGCPKALMIIFSFVIFFFSTLYLLLLLYRSPDY
jgi:hypothetical protein